MVGLFGTLGTASSGLNASDVALQTSANNISNSSTDGYSRQKVNLQTKSAYTLAGVGSIGTGVKVDGVQRDVSDYIREQIRNTNSKYESATQRSTTLGNLEDILNEPSDNGIVTQLSSMSSSWTTVANDPELSTGKSVVIEDASSFVDAIHDMASSISDLKNTTVTGIEQSALDFNTDLDDLNDINTQIYASETAGDTPNTLLDTRDSLLKSLSGLADITTSTDSYGRVSVYLGSTKNSDNLVLDASTKTVNKLSVVSATSSDSSTVFVDGDTTTTPVSVSGTYDPGTLLILSKSGDTYSVAKEATVSEGDLGGYQDALKEINSEMDDLNSFTNTVVKTINTIYNSDGSTTPTTSQMYDGLFTLSQDSTNPAADFEVNTDLVDNPEELKTGTSGNSGDSTIATAIANAFSSAMTTDGSDESVLSTFDASSLSFTTSTSGSSYATRFNNIVTTNGIAKQKADNSESSQNTLLTSLNDQDDSVSGVSINEEMADVIKYQNAFQANARMLEIVSDCLDTLINKTGV
ncbi:flagellar hook-associated protein FlgK [Ligilactobacillus sp. WILCCON 0076]|uniref:Flagellar hook-associated protein 1 n=1 Tax=Ligilactobacillus ubinensis TaxID=2876789 RepID=A0A9X2FHE9_9LACO|nr:flagellar hook-associated protein FlgK [Ligilactobacillus ubinensis]MCP0886219.1 flagellar hook-associated protein FlgK [Ligilactobacillus ubinensis]